MIPGGQSRAQLAAAIVARLTAERDALEVVDGPGGPWHDGARAGLAQAIDIVTEIAEGDGCTCAPGTHVEGWQESRCEACLQRERDAWSAMLARYAETAEDRDNG